MRSFERSYENILKLDTIPTNNFSFTDSIRDLLQTIPSPSLAEACYYFYLSDGNMGLCNKPIINELLDWINTYGFKNRPTLIYDLKEAVFEEAGRRFFNNTLNYEKTEGWKD